MPQKDLASLSIEKKMPSGKTSRSRKFKLVTGAAVFLIIVIIVVKLLIPTMQVETVTVNQVYPSQTFTVLNASGYVVAQRKASVAPKTTGQLEWLGVSEGSLVKKGQVMARLENRDSTASRDQAAANLAVSLANLDQAKVEQLDATRSLSRLKELISNGIVAQADYDSAEARFNRAKGAVSAGEAAVKAAEASLAGAGAALDYTLIKAPFDAVVLTKNADIGDIVTPIGAAANAKAAVVTIADLASLQVEADVSESNLARIKVGQPCEIQLDAFPDARFRGVLQTVVPTADRSKASVMVKVAFRNIESRMLPEMSAKVAFLEREAAASEQKPRPALLQSAVTEHDGKKFVFIVTDGVARQQPVVLGNRIGDYLEVVSGVKPGDLIVAKPSPKLKDGMKVKIPEKK